MADKVTLPVDGNNKEMQLAPNVVALARTYNATISSAVDITLNTATTYIEVTAIDKGIFVRYAATASSTNYDEFVPQNSTRAYRLPASVTVISVIQESATAKVSVIEK